MASVLNLAKCHLLWKTCTLSEVEYETMPGWKTDISSCRTFEELPEEAKNYVNRIEELVGCPVSFIGVGAGREDMAVPQFV